MHYKLFKYHITAKLHIADCEWDQFLLHFNMIEKEERYKKTRPELTVGACTAPEKAGIVKLLL